MKTHSTSNLDIKSSLTAASSLLPTGYRLSWSRSRVPAVPGASSRWYSAAPILGEKRKYLQNMQGDEEAEASPWAGGSSPPRSPVLQFGLRALSPCLWGCGGAWLLRGVVWQQLSRSHPLSPRSPSSGSWGQNPQGHRMPPLFQFTAPSVFCKLFFFKLLILRWSIADWQCYDSFRWTPKGLSHAYTCIHSPPNSPVIQAATYIEQNSLCFTVSPRWLSILKRAVCTCPRFLQILKIKRKKIKNKK